ncbi:MAG: hypothetical protein OHK0029_21650 [Armatimonadaceae bacterium]
MQDRFRSLIFPSARNFVLPALVSAALLCGGPLNSSRAADTPTDTPADAPKEKPVAENGTTRTQDTGTLTVIIKDADTGQPVPEAAVRIDGARLARSLSNRADSFGTVVFNDLPEGTYSVFFTSTTHEPFPKPQNADAAVAEVEVTAGKTTTLSLRAKEIVINIGVSEKALILNPNETANITVRDRKYFEELPLTSGNQQSLPKLLRSVPGYAMDAINQMHPRGENAVNNSIYLDGILLPMTFAGGASQYLLPDMMQKVTVRSGGVAAQYGGGSTILDINLREPTYSQPFGEAELGIGQFGTRRLVLTYSGTTPLRPRRGGQPVTDRRRIRYIFSLNNRYTDNQIEAPNSQTNFNDGTSEVFFGKIIGELGNGRDLTALLNFSSGRTNIARRTLDPALSGIYTGLGFTGTGPRNQTSQEDLEQQFRQKDNNNFVALKYRTGLGTGTAQFILGAARTRQGFYDVGTPALFRSFSPTLPADRSIDYLPNVDYDRDVLFLQGDFSPAPILNGVHRLKYGFAFHSFEGGDEFSLIPQSRRALNSLRNLDPRFIPRAGEVTPVMFTDVSGSYLSAYVQDFFKLRNGINFNVGLRFDSYRQDISSQTNARNDERGLPGVNVTEILPRLNLSYLLPGDRFRFFQQPTILRVSYNRLFTPPVYGQGNFLIFRPGSATLDPFGNLIGNAANAANAVQPQLVDLYDLSIERQIGSDKILKLSVYSKDIQRTLVTQQQIQGLQFGTGAVLNAGGGGVEGTELSFEWLPPRNNDGQPVPGVYGYLVYSNITSEPDSPNTTLNTGQFFGLPTYEFEQQDTLSLGAAYRFDDGAVAGLNIYYGSGLFGSAARVPGSPLPSEGRDSVTQVDLQYTTGPRFYNNQVSLGAEIENLFDSRSRLSFQNGIGGTRLQMGRRIIIWAGGQF